MKKSHKSQITKDKITKTRKAKAENKGKAKNTKR